MDDFSEKRKKLNAIREESARWLDPAILEATFRAYHEGEIERFEAQISSEKYVRDHEGYVLALGNLQAHQRALDALTTAQVRYNRAIKELKQLEEDEKAAA